VPGYDYFAAPRRKGEKGGLGVLVEHHLGATLATIPGRARSAASDTASVLWVRIPRAGNKPLVVAVVHIVGDEYYQNHYGTTRERVLQGLAGEVTTMAATAEVIIAGDWNADAGDGPIRRLEAEAKGVRRSAARQVKTIGLLREVDWASCHG
jgi:endonuclease/exonuclease/phosphatase family metal-dependent hydrolase